MTFVGSIVFLSGTTSCKLYIFIYIYLFVFYILLSKYKNNIIWGFIEQSWDSIFKYTGHLKFCLQAWFFLILCSVGHSPASAAPFAVSDSCSSLGILCHFSPGQWSRVKPSKGICKINNLAQRRADMACVISQGGRRKQTYPPPPQKLNQNAVIQLIYKVHYLNLRSR